MQTSTKLKIAGAGGVLLLFFGLAVFWTVSKNSYESRIADLQNQVAQRDQTVEVQKGLYQKLAVTSDQLQKQLDTKDAQVKELNNQLKKNKEELASAVSLSLTWKHAYEGLANSHQTEVPPSAGNLARKRVDFENDYGFVHVKGFTLTDPPEAWVSVSQGKPFQITVAVAQGADGHWRAFATSSDENIAVDITLAGVNPNINAPKWYEKIQLGAEVGIGNGGLLGLNAGYQVGKFSVGPAAWATWTPGENPRGYLGAFLSWRPFAK